MQLEIGQLEKHLIEQDSRRDNPMTILHSLGQTEGYRVFVVLVVVLVVVEVMVEVVVVVVVVGVVMECEQPPGEF